MSVIFQDDPEALTKLNVKLEGLEKEKAHWKTVKKIVPRDYSHSEGDAKWYMPANIQTKIRAVKKKMELIKSRQENNISLVRKPTYKDGKKCFYFEEVKN